MIVDDDAEDQELFIEALLAIDKQCKCLAASGGEEALRILLNTPGPLPDYIFLDLNMPKMNGKELLVTIKKNEQINRIPVIIYSTTSEEKEIQNTLQLGAVSFLQKPNSFRELSDALTNIISAGLE